MAIKKNLTIFMDEEGIVSYENRPASEKHVRNITAIATRLSEMVENGG